MSPKLQQNSVNHHGETELSAPVLSSPLSMLSLLSPHFPCLGNMTFPNFAQSKQRSFNIVKYVALTGKDNDVMLVIGITAIKVT